MFNRVVNNTFKQIKRSGWVAWSSVAVMTLAFFVASIFGGLAFLSNLYIQFIETRDNVLVFFDVGTDLKIIEELKEKWQVLPQIKSIGFTSEENAYNSYFAETEITKPVEHELLSQYKDKKLNSSLDIQLYSLSDISIIRSKLLADIDDALEGIKYDPGHTPIVMRIDDKTLDEFREVFSVIRIGGGVVLTLLFVIIFFFTLMTVEFRTYNRMEEIGVMQLVGGSLWYIRAPYILEGAIYGFIGALISTVILGTIGIGMFVLNPMSAVSLFVRERLQVLPIPHFEWYTWIILIALELAFGALLGALSSYLAIRRYIK